MNATLERNAQRWLLASLALFSFFAVFSIALQNLVFIAVAAWVVVRTVRRDWAWPKSAITWPLLGLACGLVLASVLEGSVNGSLFGFRKVALAVIFFAVAGAALPGVKLDRYVNLFLAGATVCGLWSIASHLAGWDGGRARSFSGDYMAAGGMYMMALALAVARFFGEKGRGRLVWIGSSTVLALALLFTYTRSSWIAAAAAILLLGLVYDWRLPAAVAVGAILLLLIFPQNPISQRAFTVTSKYTSSNVERKYMWDSGWKMFRDRPWLGYGVDNLGKYYGRYVRPEAIEQSPPHVHNTLLQLGINGGILAVLFYLAWVWAVLASGWQAWLRTRKTSPSRAAAMLGITAAFLGFVVNGFFEFNFGTAQVITIVYFLTGLLAAFAREETAAQQESRPAFILPAKPKILCLRPRFRGDVLMASIVPRLIKRDYPKARVDLLTEPPAAEVAAGEPAWDEVLVLPRGDGRAWWQMVRKIRRRHYDAVIDLFGNPRTVMLAAVSGSLMKIGPKVRVWDALLDIRTQADQPGPRPAWESFLDTLRSLGFKQLSLRPRWEVQGSDRAWAEQFVREQKLGGGKLLGLFAGGSHPAKRWPLGQFMEVSRRIYQDLGVKSVFVFGPAEAALKKEYQHARGKGSWCAENLTPGQLAALWERCAVVLANDAFPMHMGPAVNTPTLGLFGPGEPTIWFPYPEQNGHRALHHPPECWPCYKDQCGKTVCWERLTVDEVVDAVKERIEKSDPSDRSNRSDR